MDRLDVSAVTLLFDDGCLSSIARRYTILGIFQSSAGSTALALVTFFI